MKWAIVLAGAADFLRPASQLSLSQNAALMTTGAIWTRWCFIIRPQNLFLAAVNFFLFLVGGTQVTRILMWQNSVKDASVQEGQRLKEAGHIVKEKAESVVKA